MSQSTPLDSASGTFAGNTYRVVHFMDEGAMGPISLARDPRGDWVTLYRLAPDLAGNAALLGPLRMEVCALTGLTHPGIVQVYGIDADEEGPFVVTEYVAGPDSSGRDDWPPALPNPPLTLETCIREQSEFDALQVVQVGRLLCRALGYAHQHGTAHGDIKPANVVLSEKGEPKLTNFKLRCLAEGEGGAAMAGAQLLTMAYLAPEQEIDPSWADGRSDVYALGETLWFLLTGRDPRYFSEADVPQPLRGVLVKALQKNRDRRFRTAGEFEQALANLDFLSAAPPERATARAGASATDSTARSNRASALPEPTQGQCPACGHQHALHPNEIFKRKYCGGCGGPMLEPCLNCGDENAVWEKHCGSCGADLAAAVQAAAKNLQADRERIDGLRKASRFTDARACLERMANANHPRLAQYAAWAKETLLQVDAELGAAASRRDAGVKQAESLIASRDFAAAVSVLQDIPEAAQTPKSAEFLRQARAALAEVDTLHGALRSGVAGNQFEDLKRKAVRLRELQPNDSVAGDILQQLKVWEDQRDANIEQAERLLAQRDFAAAVPLLQGIVEAVRTPKSAELLRKSQEALAEINTLRNEIRRRVAAKQFKDLKPKAIRLRELQPKDNEAQGVLSQFATWEDERDAIIPQAESLMARHDFAAAIKLLEGISELARTTASAVCLLKAQSAIEEIDTLRNEIRSCLATKQFGHLKPTALRLQELQPNDAEAESVLRHFDDWEDQRDAAIRHATALMARHDFAASIKVLQGIADAAKTPDSARLLLQAQSAMGEIDTLRNEIRRRVAAKQIEGLEPTVTRLLELQPNNSQAQSLLQQVKDWQLRQEEKFWEVVSTRHTIQDYYQYLQTYPNGIHVQQARRALPSLLRKKLLMEPNNVEVRKDYLDKRTPELAAEDEEMALQNTRVVCAIAAGVGGAIAGALVGGVGGWFGAVLAGLVTGFSVVLFLDR